MEKRKIKAGVLEITYLAAGDESGWPVILNHGFPYDVHAYAETAPLLAAAGARVIIPYLRGFGETRFLSDATPRSGEQAALGFDLLNFMDSLQLERAILAGYDWGGRAACIVAALWPERVSALVSGNSYNIQNIAAAMKPLPARIEASFWYQYYFHSERGRRGLEENRREITRLLWEMWSPRWQFTDETFARTARAFDNPDFVEVIIHSYRHRYGLVPGDPALSHIEVRLARQPDITVPTIAIDGGASGVGGRTARHRSKFTGPFDYRIFENAGHNLPQENPALWTQAILDARRMSMPA